MENILVVFSGKLVENTLKLSSKFVKVFGSDLIVVVLEKKEEIKKDAVENVLKSLGIRYEIFIEKNGLKDKITDFVKKFSPELIILPHEKIDPMLHIFKHPEQEKFVEKFEEKNIIFPVEDADDIKKSIIYINPDKDTESYIKTAYELLSPLSDVEFIYAFHEEYYEYSLRKTHPDEEARKIIQDLYQEGVEKTKKLIANAVGKELVLKIIKGDPKKEVPFFAFKNGYDLLAINIENEDKKSFIENTEISLGLFKG